MNAAAQLGIIALVSLAAAGGTRLVKSPPPKLAAFVCDPTKIRDDEICLYNVAGKVLWVDARSRAEWKENGVAGSILWNLDPKEDQNEMEAGSVSHIASGVELVVVYCSSEACGTSRQIAERIRRLDLGPKVKTLHGGWDALKGRGSNPVTDSSSEP